ncbi:MAG: poly(ribitol-phosphate) beta-N-acetylglucosaminyltransferase [Frankiaceae bacterium]|nr:poly(ribitol-phosphate) beta-N-acetylglucosaminyltransferase [Frankiaceae bacterium]
MVVPVYNTGPFIEPCIDSLVKQSLPPDRYEVIFVDDGSTDETPARLDRLAAEQPHVRVFHIPNSGWPGRPRNVGIDNALGDYVYFCDHDDWLGPEALERMTAFARQNDADIVIGKMVGHQRGAPRELFRRNVDRATFQDTRLMSSLTPHKLFRRSFLDEHELRFPEGKRRLEDHVFVVKAYMLAKRISVLSDYACYHHTRRPDGGNAAHEVMDPVAYYGYVRETLDIIEQHTEPGDLRDELMSRPFRQEMLTKLGRKKFLKVPVAHQEHRFAEIRRLMNERFPADFGERFGYVTRARAAAVRDGNLDAVVQLIHAEAKLSARAFVHDFHWDGSGWLADLEGELIIDGSPVLLTESGDDTWEVDPRLVPPGIDTRPLTTRELLRESRATVVAINRATREQVFGNGRLTPELRGARKGGPLARRVVLRGEITIDPVELAYGGDVKNGRWDVVVRIGMLGTGADARPVPRKGAALTLPRPVVVGPLPTPVIPFFTDTARTLTIDVGQRARTVAGEIASRPIDNVRTAGGRLSADVQVDGAPAAAVLPVSLVLMRGTATVGTYDATIEATAAGGRLVCDPGEGGQAADRAPVRRGRYAVALRSKPTADPAVIGVARIDRQGRFASARLDPQARIMSVEGVTKRVKERSRRSALRLGQKLRQLR